ncbi:hypothetical protein EcoM_00010 [Escherichia coli WV_060327]|nr:hypothetical protein EcoM_00010 [Escherichia coli WV_060327]
MSFMQSSHIFNIAFAELFKVNELSAHANNLKKTSRSVFI